MFVAKKPPPDLVAMWVFALQQSNLLNIYCLMYADFCLLEEGGISTLYTDAALHSLEAKSKVGWPTEVVFVQNKSA